MEVSQIARTIARCLRLNEDLTEAISLGHDIGHTPFGHAGKSIKPNLSIGIQTQRTQSQGCGRIGGGERVELDIRGSRRYIKPYRRQPAVYSRGRVVRMADRIAYINHDIEDAISGKVITAQQIPKECVKMFGKTIGERIDFMVKNIVQNSKETNDIVMSKEFFEAMEALRNFMFEYVYVDSIAKKEEKKAENMLEYLYMYLDKNFEVVEKELEFTSKNVPKERTICDYIAGMTDRFAVKIFEKYFVPKFWMSIDV